MGQRSRVGLRSYSGNRRLRFNGPRQTMLLHRGCRRSRKADRHPSRHGRSVAAPRESRAMAHNLLASRWDRFVANPCRSGLPDGFWIQVATAIGRSLFDLDRNPVRIGECILADTSDLPRDFHIRFVRLDAELVVRNLPSHNGLRELSDHGELVAKITIEGL